MHCRSQGISNPDMAASAEEYPGMPAEDLAQYVRLGKLACKALRAGASRGFALTAAQAARATPVKSKPSISSSGVGREHSDDEVCLAESAQLSFMQQQLEVATAVSREHSSDLKKKREADSVCVGTYCASTGCEKLQELASCLPAVQQVLGNGAHP